MGVATLPTDRRLADAVAGVPARLVSASSVVLLLWLLGDVAGEPQLFWWPLVAWGAGVALSFAFPEVRSLFTSYSGVGVGVVVAAVLTFGIVAVFALTESRAEPPVHLYLVALVPLGLDWHLVRRLRLRVLVTGFGVVVLVGLDGSGTWSTSGGGGAVLVAMVWFATALAALWLLHRDQLGALPRPSPLGGAPAAGGSGVPTDFLFVAGVSALIAVLVALVVAGPSCLPWEGCARSDAPFGDVRLGEGLEGVPGDAGRLLPSPGGGAGGSGGLGGSAGGSGGLGDEGGYFYDPEGRAYAYHPGTDSFLRVPPADAYGYDPGTGYHYDGDGRAYRYEEGTDRYRRAPAGDGLVPDGGGRLFRKDRDGDVWIPHVNGKPLPPGAELSEGRLLDGVVIDGVIVGGSLGDPGDGRWLPDLGSPGEAGGGSSGSDGSGPDWARVARVVGGLLLIVGLLGLAVWWLRRRTLPDEQAPEPVAPPDRPWAEAMVRRLVAIGARHGRARAMGEPVASYGRALAGDPVGDDRLAAVGAALSAALFGPTEAPAEERAWVEAVLDEIDAADAAAAGAEPVGVSP